MALVLVSDFSDPSFDMRHYRHEHIDVDFAREFDSTFWVEEYVQAAASTSICSLKAYVSIKA